MHDHNRKVRNVPLLLTRRQYIYVHQAAMITSVAKPVETEPCNKLMISEKVTFWIIEGSPMTISIEKEEIWNTFSIYWDTLAPPAEFAERQIVYTVEQ